MRKLFTMSLVVILVATFGFADSHAAPASKATSQCGDIAVVKEAAGYGTIFTQTIKVPEKKDLFVDVSLECGLTTDTKVLSKKLLQAYAEAEASVMVRVLLDGKPILPGEITFAKRKQTLIAKFAGDISGCITDEGTIFIDDTCVLEEELQLILATMTANSFNFIANDVESGLHTIDVQAKLEYKTVDGTTVENPGVGEALANAYLGKGSVTVECVRMVSGEDVDPTELQ